MIKYGPSLASGWLIGNDLDAATPIVENGLPPVFDSEEDMSDNKPTLTERMNDVEAALGLRAKESQPSWIIRHWKDVVLVLALIIALLAWLQPEWKAKDNLALENQINNQIESKLKEDKLDQVVPDLAGIKAQLATISDFVKIIAQKEMQHAAALPLPDFERGLPQLKTALQAAKSTGAEASPAVIQTIQSRLSESNRDQPEFWGTAAALITYQAPQIGKEFPNCAQTSSMRQVATAENNKVSFKQTYLFHDCLFNLDNSLPDSSFFPKPGSPGSGNTIECDRCQVTYSGGTIPVLGANGVKMLVFIACTFKFDASDNSPVLGKNLIASVLTAKDKQAITYSVLSG